MNLRGLLPVVSVLLFTFLGRVWSATTIQGDLEDRGSLKKWHMVEITFDGPSRNETNAATFTDSRLDVKFTPPRGPGYWVPGFFAADGDAANSGAGSGNKWRVRLMPNREGTWKYEVSFRTGSGIAYDPPVPTTGATAAPHGQTGSFNVGPSGKDPFGVDFRGKGMLYYVNKHHLRFGESGEYWIMGGPGSPEDMMGFQDFDNTPGHGHHWNPHSGDFSAADSATYLWKNGTKGHNLLGATKYIADEGMNSLYIIMITAPVGDTKTSFPWISPNSEDWEKYDVSKLEQWEYYFSYCDKKGINLHLFFGETENDTMICGDFSTGDKLKLCYREIVARFAHHHGVLWDLCEEYDGSAADIKSKTDYLHAVDPYDHPATCHSRNNKVSDRYRGLFGHPTIEAASMQHWCVNVKRDTEYCRDNSTGTRPYCVFVTESNRSVPRLDANDPNDVIVDCRKNAMWGSLMGWGAGIEWYFGNDTDGWSDLKSNKWNHAHGLWDDTKHALDFFMARGESDRRPVPFQNMKNADGRFGEPGNWCLFGSDDNGKPCMVVYTDDGGSFPLNVPMAPKYMVGWMNARTGVWQYGSTISGHPGGTIDFTAPGKDEWVLLLYDWSVGTSSPIKRASIALASMGADSIVAAGSDGKIVSLDEIDIEDLILGKTTADLENMEDHPAAHADNFDLTTYASLDGASVIKTVFDVPVSTIFIVEMGANDSGFFQPIDADGNPIGGKLAFTDADFQIRVSGFLASSQQLCAVAIEAEAPINGLLILPPTGDTHSIDPMSISAVPARVSAAPTRLPLIALAPMDADGAVATGGDNKLVTLNGIDVTELVLGRTTADLESHADHPAAHADNFDLATYASLDGSSVIKTVFDVPVSTIFIMEMGANDSGFFQPIDADGNPIGGKLAFTAADFRYRVKGLLINAQAGQQEVGGIAIVAEVPINGLLILPPTGRTNSIDPMSVSAVPAKSLPLSEKGLGSLDEDGFIAIEVEKASLVGDWKLETEYSGYTGAGYYIWRGGLTRNQNDNTILAYKVKITNPGDYYFEIRNLHAFEDKTEDNDAFTRMDNGDWVKTFSHVNKEWTWDMGHDFEGVFVKPPVYENLSAGYHTFYIAARSPNFALDRIHFFREGTQNRPHTEPESSTEVGEPVTLQLSAVETVPPDTGSGLVRSH